MTNREIQDLSLQQSAALPNAANTVNGGSLDLGQTTPFPVTEQLSVRIETSTAAGANNKNINIRLQDSPDNGNWTNLALLANPVLRVTDANGAGYAAANVVVALPPGIKRYLRGVALGEANGGDASDGTFKVSLLF